MKIAKIWLLCIILVITLYGCTKHDRNINGVIEIESDTILSENWELDLDSEIFLIANEDDILYLITKNKSIYVINLENGQIINSFELNLTDKYQYLQQLYF